MRGRIVSRDIPLKRYVLLRRNTHRLMFASGKNQNTGPCTGPLGAVFVFAALSASTSPGVLASRSA